jgi:hypothetical protein
MALSDQERERIIEEERVRWTARRTLLEDAFAQHAGHGCGYGQAHWHGRGRAWRLLFWLPLLGLAVWSLSRAFCHI